MARDRFEEMLGFHTREQARLEAEADRWVNRLFGRSNGYDEAAYAHECAIQHLKPGAGESEVVKRAQAWIASFEKARVDGIPAARYSAAAFELIPELVAEIEGES